uniref:Uncharacterized protein n=1 Tax=Candidatus Kentrum sp. LPFa TaxID=2126335 RepID=A0A450WQ93_9GAMM|nr:MAG: hypothetical protein BECKLPF1236B_GA0070989_11634 [Candidatus Kentron sp. LPFa]
MSFKDRWYRDKARKRAKKNRKIGSDLEQLSVGIGWYTEKEWNRLTEIVPDRSELDATYQDWKKSADEAIGGLKDRGVIAARVMIEVADLQAWCQTQGRPVDAEARAAYISHLLIAGKKPDQSR